MARKPAVIFINRKAYRVRIPSGADGEVGSPSEWKTLLLNVGGADELCHWSGIWSWCQEPFRGIPWPEDKTLLHKHKTPAHRILRGCVKFASMNTADCTTRGSYIGFRPILEPMDPESMTVDTTRWPDLKDGQIISLGTLYLDGRPIPIPLHPTSDGDIPDYKPGADLRIGQTHTDPACQLRMIKCGNLFLSDRNLIKNISWNDLDRCGLVYGEKSKTSPPKPPKRPKSTGCN